jgi:hypothetical protein
VGKIKSGRISGYGRWKEHLFFFIPLSLFPDDVITKGMFESTSIVSPSISHKDCQTKARETRTNRRERRSSAEMNRAIAFPRRTR